MLILKIATKVLFLLYCLNVNHFKINTRAYLFIHIDGEGLNGKFGPGNYIEAAIKRGFKVANQDANIDADGYYQPKPGEIISPSSVMQTDDDHITPAKSAQYKIIGISGKG